MNTTRSLISVTSRLLAMLVVLFLSAATWAQPGPDAGQWQILQARYGTADRNVDVTDQLRNLARQGATFRVTNRTFGSDPAPGRVKTLRIYARAANGSTRTFEYVENDIVDGNQYVGWRGGNWGQGGWEGGWGGPGYDPSADVGQWRILAARYGTRDRNIDVTQALRNLARQNATFRVTNNTFGNDPAPGPRA